MSQDSGGASNDGAVDLALMEPIFAKYGGEEGALIPILQQAQGLYGYLPPEALRLIAEQLDVALSRVYGVATFYSQFYLERRGRHVLHLCDGTACHVKGSPGLMEAIEKEFGVSPGETTDDYELTVETVYCMGSCALAPVAVLDRQVMGRMGQKQLVRTVKRVTQADGADGDSGE